jgi:hypothetical protein
VKDLNAEVKDLNADIWWLCNDEILTPALNPASSFQETTEKGQDLSCQKEKAGVSVNRAMESHMLCYIKKTALDASKVDISLFSIWNILLFIIYMLR